jgi:TrmH family RNA methyltransferase
VVVERITSSANPRVKTLAKLKKARVRRETGLFLIEGEREIERALAAGLAVDTLLVSSDRLDTSLPQVPESVDVLELSADPMGKVSTRQNPAGAIAVAHQFDTYLDQVALGETPLVLIAERMEKPGNLGAMMRTADAAGADAVVIADSATDIFNPNVVRASQGALFLVSLAIAPTASTIEWTQEKSLQVVAGYPEATVEMWDVDLTNPTAILVGAEDTGISGAWRQVATPVRIPMVGSSDSLNASVSAALLLYEAMRQRREAT